MPIDQPAIKHTYNFCPNCGQPNLETLVDDDGFTCRSCGEFYYLNSKPSVCAIIVVDDEVLLVQQSDGPMLWDLPGGFLNWGEDPIVGLRREIDEELGAEIGSYRLLNVLADTYGTRGEFSLNIFYDVRLVAESITLGVELSEYGWFQFDCLPKIKYQSTYDVLRGWGRS